MELHPKNDPHSDSALIDRDLHLRQSLDTETGEKKSTLKVEHGSFVLPEDGRSKGLAKKILRDSFRWYSEQKEYGTPVQRVDLLANVGVGGYAWASYGFGWNQEKMMTRNRTAYKDKIAQPDKRTSEKVWEETLFSHLTECQARLARFLKKVKAVPPAVTASFSEELHEIATDIQDVTKIHLVTPQRFASAGKGLGAFIEIQTPTGSAWYHESMAVPGKELQRWHLGKAMTLASRWDATMPLEATTPLEARQLALLRERIGF